MSALSNHINELKAAEGFSKQAPHFDALYGHDLIIQYKRQRVRQQILQYLQAGDHLLELNCGSGEDAIFFAQKGFAVHATDISDAMLQVMETKLKAQSITAVTTERCSFTELELLRERGPFDHIYSNFGGLNCTGDLGKVLHSLNALLKPGGNLTLVIISRFCLWETLLVFRGKFRVAFRRFFSGGGRKAHLEGSYFKCWYYSPAFVKKHLKSFETLELEGLCTLVPPSYIEHFGEKHPAMFSFLKNNENKLKNRWPWKYWGDYYIISLRKIS